MIVVFNFFGILLILFMKLAVCEESDSGTGDKLVFAHMVG